MERGIYVLQSQKLLKQSPSTMTTFASTKIIAAKRSLSFYTVVHILILVSTADAQTQQQLPSGNTPQVGTQSQLQAQPERPRSQQPSQNHPNKEQRLYRDNISTQPPGTISSSQYIGGGLLGTLVGFGLGYMIHGSWKKTGWIFTLTESLSLSMALAGILTTFSSHEIGILSASSGDDSGLTVFGIGALGFLSMRIVETVCIWAGPRVYNVVEIDPVPAKPQVRLNVTPWIAPNSGGLAASLTF